jgi:hypothetical protein
METVQLIVNIEGLAYPFFVTEITDQDDAIRKFEVKDLFSKHILQRNENGEWVQVNGMIELYPQNLKSVGAVIQKYFKLEN